MASKIIGRASCPECGFDSAHIKESEKCVYRYCPECGAQYHAKTQRQRADLMAKTRAVDAPAPAPVPAAAAPAPALPVPAAVPKKPAAPAAQPRALHHL